MKMNLTHKWTIFVDDVCIDKCFLSFTPIQKYLKVNNSPRHADYLRFLGATAWNFCRAKAISRALTRVIRESSAEERIIELFNNRDVF